MDCYGSKLVGPIETLESAVDMVDTEQAVMVKRMQDAVVASSRCSSFTTYAGMLSKGCAQLGGVREGSERNRSRF